MTTQTIALCTSTEDALHQAYPQFSIVTPQNVLHDYYVPCALMPIECNYNERPRCLHYLPPAAVSTRYYALHDPNIYIDEKPCYDAVPSPQNLQIPSPSDPSCDSSVGSPDVDMTSWCHYPYECKPVGLAEAAPSPHPNADPHYMQQEFSAQSDPVACAQPDLPNQRRNRDDPGGDAGPLAQPAALCEGQMEPPLTEMYLAPENTVSHGVMLQEHEEPKAHVWPTLVPSQWKLGAALDRLRFPEYGGDWDTMMAKVTGRPYQQTLPRSTSPLSEEDMARFDEMRVSLGLADLEQHSTPPATPASDVGDMTAYAKANVVGKATGPAAANSSKMVIYSPTTARRIPVNTGPRGPVLQITSAKKPYKRATIVACAFCRRRKIACGGPLEGDEAKRCGQCIQRHQSCEFPTVLHRASRPSPTQTRFPAVAGFTGPVHVQDFCQSTM